MPTKTTPTLTEVEAAQAALGTARADADAAEERAKVARAEADTRRRAALEAYDRQVLDAYDEAELDATTAAARQAVLDAAEADPVWRAMADLAEASGIAYAATTEAQRIVQTLGVDRQVGQRSPAGDLTLDAVLRHMTRVASARAADATDAADVKRNAVGDAAAAKS